MTWNKTFRSAALAIALLFSGHAEAVGVLPLSGSQQFDKDTSPPAFLTGGQLFIFNVGTTTPAAVFSDSALTVPLPSPIVLNTAGRIPPVYGAEGLSVRMRLLNSASVLQFDDDAIPLAVAPISSTPIVITPDQLWAFADVKVRFDDQPVSGYVRCNGRTIGSAVSGSSERANSDTENLFKFLWTFANISVVTGKGATAAADWSSNKQLTLPDCAGRMIAGRDDLGAGAKSRITAATVTGPTLAGAVGGQETTTLAQANLPNATVTVSVTGNLTSGTVNITNQSQFAINAQPAGAGFNTYSIGGGSLGFAAALANTALTGSGNTASINGGVTQTTTNNLSPVMLFTIYLKL